VIPSTFVLKINKWTRTFVRSHFDSMIKTICFALGLFLSTASIDGRVLSQCSSSALTSASSFAQNAVAEAVSGAFAECKACPCLNEASSAADSAATAIARAMADTQLSVIATPGCKGSASGSSSATSVAQASATALAKSLADACGTIATSENKAVEQALAQAAATASAEIQGNGSNAQATAQSISEDIKTAIAKATSQALASCKCGGENQAGAGSSAESTIVSPSPVPSGAQRPTGWNQPFPGGDILDFSFDDTFMQNNWMN
jgi:hypothetical protein